MAKRPPANPPGSPSNDERAFLAEILAAPDDDTPRLIWADWLEERGDPRATFIRLQCAAAKLPAWDTLRREVEQGAHQLWRVYHAQWLATAPKLWDSTWLPFERGLPAGLVFQHGPRALERDAERAFAESPAFRLEVNGFAFRDRFSPPEPAPAWLRRIREFEFEAGGAGGPEPILLAQVPTGQLRRLAVMLSERWNWGLSGGSARGDARNGGVLTQVARFQLESLEVARFTGPLSALFSQQRLRSLAIRQSRLAPEELRLLIAAPSFATLEALDLSGTPLEAEALGQIATGLAMQSLRSLRLAGCGPLDARGIAGYLPHLTELDLSRINAANQTLAALSEARGLKALRTLNLAANGITPAGVQELASSSLLRRLQALDLSHNQVGDVGAQALAESPQTAGLKFLELKGAGIGEAGGLALARSPHLQGLVSLSLHGNRLTDRAVAALRDRFELELVHNFERLPQS